MSFFNDIKKHIESSKVPCTHQNEAAGWFSRVEKNGLMVIYQFDKNGDLKNKRYKNINTFARAIMRKLSGC